MENIITLLHDDNILPGINELVDLLFNENINNFIDKKCESVDDRRTIFMFVMMYFYTYLSIPDNMKMNKDLKQNLKIFLSDMIHNKDKRLKCLEMYTMFENTIKSSSFDNILKIEN